MARPSPHFRRSIVGEISTSSDISMANYHVLSVRVVAFEWGCHASIELLLADALFLVPVAVSLLRKRLVAKRAWVGTRIGVSTNVILHIGKLVELFVTDLTLHLLILTASLLVNNLHSPPQLLFLLNDLVFETWHLGGGNIIVFCHIFCSVWISQLRAKDSIWAEDMLSLEGANSLHGTRTCHDREFRLAEGLVCDLKISYVRRITGSSWRWSLK